MRQMRDAGTTLDRSGLRHPEAFLEQAEFSQENGEAHNGEGSAAQDH